MPAAVAIPLIVAAVGGTAQAVAAHKSAGASRRASNLQYRSTSEALALEREMEMQRRTEHDREQNELRRQHDMREQNAMPYRQAAASVLANRFTGGRAPGLAGLVAPREYQPVSRPSNGLGDLVRQPRY